MADCIAVSVTGGTAAAIRRTWRELESRFGAGRAHREADPHLTLAVAPGAVGSEEARRALAVVARDFPPFSAAGSGYGVFVGHDREPVLHMSVTTTPRLAALHEAVVLGLGRAGVAVDPETRPDYWRPHINLADQGPDGGVLAAGTAGAAVAYLIEHGPRHWTIEVAAVALLAGPGGAVVSFPLQGREPVIRERGRGGPAPPVWPDTATRPTP